MITKPNCKVCGSTFRAEAEALFRVRADRAAVHRLLIERDQVISYASVKNHFARHYVTPAPTPPEPEVVVSAPAAMATGADILAVLDEGHALALRQVRRLAAVDTNERNIGPISASLFRSIDLLVRQADLRARLLGYYHPADGSTIVQVEEFASQLATIVAALPEPQREALAPQLAALRVGRKEVIDA